MEKQVMVWIALVCLGFVWILRRYMDYFRSVILALRLPGPPALPLIGNTLMIKNTEAILEIGTNISKLYTPLLRAWMFFVPLILVYEPEHLKVILGSTKVSDKNFFYSIMHTFIGDGLITSTGGKWRRNRRLIQPHFQINLLERYLEDFVEVSEEMVKGLSGLKRVQVTKFVNKCVLRILHKTALGVNLKSDHETPFRRCELLILKRVLKPWLLLDSVFKYSQMSLRESRQSTELYQYVKKILDERRARKESKTPCILNGLIELSETTDFSDEDIVNEAVTFTLAGQDSVAAAVVFCLYHLAKHQDVQEKVFREIDQVIDGDNFKTMKIDQLHYLEQCIKESLRLLPSIPLVSRVLISDVTLGNYTIPRGTNIFVSPYATHRLPHIFPDPLKFDPDRFSKENIKKIHPFGFIPFSAGPRNCIGYKFAYLEMKTIIASLIKNYQLFLKAGSEDLSLNYRVTLRCSGGLWLDIKQRNKRYVD